MSSFGSQIRKRLDELRRAGQDMPKILAEVAEGATIEAVPVSYTHLINKGDAIHNTQYTFTGLPDVYDRVMMDVAGAARTPVTKLFGRSPAGLNAVSYTHLYRSSRK